MFSQSCELQSVLVGNTAYLEALGVGDKGHSGFCCFQEEKSAALQAADVSWEPSVHMGGKQWTLCDNSSIPEKP